MQQEQLSVQLTNQNGGIGKISVYFNGAEVIEDLRPDPNQNLNQASLAISIDLNRFRNRFDTLNSIKIIAYNGDGWISSQPQFVDFRPSIASRGTELAESKIEQRDSIRLYAVIVGTSNIGLSYAHKDAQQFHSGLLLAAQELFGASKVSSQLLVTKDGTRQQSPKGTIIQALKDAQEARPGDVFVLYLSGHGINYGGMDRDFYYLTAGAKQSDAAYLGDEAVRRDFAISSRELAQYMNLIPARKKVLILDVCSAGSGANRLLALARDVPSSQVRALDRLQDRTGFYVLAGSSADRVSYEASRYGQGLLTYALLKGMRGNALRRDGSKGGSEEYYVDVEQLFGYAVNEVPELAKSVQGVQQPFYRGSDDQRTFDVGKVTSNIRQQIQLAQAKPVLLFEGFQEEFHGRDLLKLTAGLEGKLLDLKAQGAGPFEYIETLDYQGAYSLTGRYKLEGDKVILTCRLFEGDDPEPKLEFTLPGQKSRLPELVKAVTDELQKQFPTR